MKSYRLKARLQIGFIAPLLVMSIAISVETVYAEIKQGLTDTGRVCAVDMGSSTFKFIVAEIKNGKYLQYTDWRKTAGVGDDLKKSQKESGRKVISKDKAKEIQSLLTQFQDECERQTHSRKIHAIATAAFREAENGKAISEQLHKQGVEVQILTGEGESIYAYEAATLGEHGLAVVDLGSRTTEFVSNRGGSNYQYVELAGGYKTAWDDFYQNAKTFSQASAQHLKQMNELGVGEKGKKILRQARSLVVIEVGEPASYLLGIPQNEIEGKIITRSQIQNKLKDLLTMNAKSFADLKSNLKDAPKILPRLVFLDFVLGETGFEKFEATDRELNVAIVYRLSRLN
jgi:exopolyphosphatase/pppGpp-phosphohydrolase